ncbi:hypothetical protein GCM10009122_35320 [Fulvivirga kasyanovii]|uniref:Uncharacterized protein n=1 Tax=Fulvivirga kasyanovii TaxID=396812 RepID=A0ABW9RTT6_9BACT|nr:hypothetical protein [Fulvivirga kasyanovii]MTI27593.1 hypothetical protein [Fulvivirga kasyanovii]
MGLQEKKAINAIKEQYFGDYQKELNEVVGKELPIEINWETFDLNSIKFIPSVCLQRTVDAFKKVCSDQDGKEAVQESINRIEVNNIEEANAGELKSLSLANGTFLINACYGGHHSGFFTDTDMKGYLESNL